MHRALIVEDEQLAALSLQADLRLQGFDRIHHATNADEALTAFRQEPFDLVILDVNLGGAIDGIGVGAMIRQQSPVPILYLTAYGDSQTVARATQTRPAAYLCKPVSSTQLQASLAAAQAQPLPPLETPIRNLTVEVLDRLTRSEGRLQDCIDELSQRIRHNSLNSLWGDRFRRDLRAEQEHIAHNQFLIRQLMSLLHSRRERKPHQPLDLNLMLPPLVRMTLGDRECSVVGETYPFLGDGITLLTVITDMLEIAAEIGDRNEALVINLTRIGQRIGLSLLLRKPAGLDRFLEGHRSSELAKQRIRTRMAIAQSLATSLDSDLTFVDETDYCFFSLSISERFTLATRRATAQPQDWSEADGAAS